MFTRYSIRFFGLILIITASVAVPRRNCLAVVISRSFDLRIPSLDDPKSENDMGRMADAIIDIDEHISITDIDVAVSLEHDSFYDLEIVLKGPSGISITLNPSLNPMFLRRDSNDRYEPVGGTNRFLFDDEAAVGIKEATLPWDQPFRPADDLVKLSAFDGDAFGQWRVQIQDSADNHIGRLTGVEFIITSPEPSSIFILGLLSAIATVLKPRRAGR